MNKRNFNKSKPKASFLEQSKELSDVFPSPAMLESFEEIHPGMVGELLTMVQKEQTHRHRLEKNIIKSQAYTKRIGQLLVFALAVIIIYSAITFSVEGMFGLAFATILGGFAFLTATSFAPLLLYQLKQNAKALAKKHAMRSKQQHKGNRPKQHSQHSNRSHHQRRRS